MLLNFWNILRHYSAISITDAVPPFSALDSAVALEGPAPEINQQYWTIISQSVQCGCKTPHVQTSTDICCSFLKCHFSPMLPLHSVLEHQFTPWCNVDWVGSGCLDNIALFHMLNSPTLLLALAFDTARACKVLIDPDQNPIIKQILD